MFSLGEAIGLNTVITSKEAIMQVCRRIVAEKGMNALNMRLVADECGIALDTLYNYFAGKDAPVLAAVESIWRDIFHAGTPQETAPSFPAMWRCCTGASKRARKPIPGF